MLSGVDLIKKKKKFCTHYKDCIIIEAFLMQWVFQFTDEVLVCSLGSESSLRVKPLGRRDFKKKRPNVCFLYCLLKILAIF